MVGVKSCSFLLGVVTENTVPSRVLLRLTSLLGCQATIILKIVACALPDSLAPPLINSMCQNQNEARIIANFPIHAPLRNQSTTNPLPACCRRTVSIADLHTHLSRGTRISVHCRSCPFNKFRISSLKTAKHVGLHQR